MKCCLPFVTSILILCVHNSFFVCLLAEWYRVIFTLCFHFFSLCYDSMFIFIAHSLLLLFSFIAAAVDDDVVVAFSLTHTWCRITFHTMYSHCANFFYPSRTRLAYTHTFERIKCFFCVCFCYKTEWLEYHGATNECDSIIMGRRMNTNRKINNNNFTYVCLYIHLNHHCRRHDYKMGRYERHMHSGLAWPFDILMRSVHLFLHLACTKTIGHCFTPCRVCVRFFCFKFAVEVIKGTVKPINRPMAWLWWQLSTFSPVFSLYSWIFQ